MPRMNQRVIQPYLPSWTVAGNELRCRSWGWVCIVHTISLPYPPWFSCTYIVPWGLKRPLAIPFRSRTILCISRYQGPSLIIYRLRERSFGVDMYISPHSIQSQTPDQIRSYHTPTTHPQTLPPDIPTFVHWNYTCPLLTSSSVR